MENSSESEKVTGESVEEMKALIDGYQRLLIAQDKKLSVMLGRLETSAPFLRKHSGKFFYALIIEASIRLLVIIALWLFIIPLVGFSGRTFMWMLISLILYAALEALDIMSKIKLVKEAIY